MKTTLVFAVIILLYFNVAKAQRESNQRIPLIGTQAPAFKAPSTNGPVNFPDDYGTDWKILFAHPRDFTPVCSSEILELAYRQDEFRALGAHIIVISVDRMASHKNQKSNLEEINYKGRGKVKIEFTLVVDSSAAISYNYGMIDTKSTSNQSVRGVFFVDPENHVRAFQLYPNEVGRSTDEIHRTLKTLQYQFGHQNIVIPANWHPGDDVMIPILTKEDKEKLRRAESKVHFINWYMIYRRYE